MTVSRIVPDVRRTVGVLLALALSLAAAFAAEPQGIWFVFDIGFGNAAAYYGDAVGIEFEARVLDQEGPHTVFRKVWRESAWYPAAVDLGRWAGKEVTLQILTRPWYDRMGHEYCYVGDPRVVVGDILSPDPADRTTVFRLLDTDLYEGATVPVAGALREGMWAMPTRVGDETVRRFEFRVKLPACDARSREAERPWLKERAKALTGPGSRIIAGAFAILDTATERFPLNPDAVAFFDREQLTFEVGMGTENPAPGETRDGRGYACAGFEAVGLDRLQAAITVTGHPERLTLNSYLGLVVDYHTPAGYSRRVYLALDNEAAHPEGPVFDGRAPLWNINFEALSRRATAAHETRYEIMAGSGIVSSAVGLELGRWAPADWDGGLWFGAVAIDQPVTMKVRLTGVNEMTPVPSPRSVEQADAGGCPVLRNEEIAVALSPETGAVAGLWDLRLGRRVVEKGDDRYRIERMEGVSKSAERFDRVASVTRRAQEVEIRCSNTLFSDLLVTKVYRFGDSPRELSKTVTFRSRADGGYFIEHFSELHLDRDFGREGRFDFSPGTQPEDVMRTATLGTRSEATFEHTGQDRVIAQYRYRINGRYVMPVTDVNFAADGTYLPSGWRFPVFADHLDKGSESSAEVRTLVLEGDEFDYYSYYDGLPEVAKVYDIEVSEWLWKECRLDAMRLTGYNLTHFKHIPCMTTKWDLNPLWGDYVSEGDIVIGGNTRPWPTRRAVDIAAMLKGVAESHPDWRVSMYSWQWSIARSTRVISGHPEFIVTTRDGEFEYTGQGHDITGEPAFRKQLRAPGCMDYFVDQYRRWAEKMNVQFIYIDGAPTGISRLDWKLKTVQQNYDWLEFFRRIRETLRSRVPDGFVFLNCNNSPYSDAGYYEDHRMGERIRENWRPVAHKYMVMKYRERPRRWHALLYWNESTTPFYSNYTLGFGWTYSISDEGPEVLKRIAAYVGPAWELRGSRMVMAVDAPRFWRDATDYEVYSLRKGSEGLVSVISHKDGLSVAPIRLDAAVMGLDAGRPVHVWQLRMRDPRHVNEWAHDGVKCFAETYLGVTGIHDGKLDLNVEARPLLLELIVLTQDPLWFTDVNGEELGTVQNNLLTASIEAADGPGNYRMNVEEGDATVFLLAPDSGAPTVLLDGATCPVAPAQLGNAEGYAVRVPQGTHLLSVKESGSK